MKISTIMFLACGGVAATALGWMASDSKPTAATPSPSRSRADTSSRPKLDSTLDRQHVQRLSRRLDRLEAEAPIPLAVSSDRGHPDDEVESDEDWDDLSPEDRAEVIVDEWKARLDEHEDSPRDEAWAERTETNFDGALAALAEEHAFRSLGTSCASTTCRALVEFDHFDAAVTEYGSLLHHDYGVNCERETILPEPGDVYAPYVVNVLYHCER